MSESSPAKLCLPAAGTFLAGRILPQQTLNRSKNPARWRTRIFILSWVSYAAFYLCRKNLSVLIPLLVQQEGVSTQQLANVVFGFSVAYALGQFAMGRLADRFGSRLIVAFGMAGSAVATALFGFGHSWVWLLSFQILNGLLQASGWSSLVKLMGSWFERKRRGVTMAWWSTNYVFGGFLATMLATSVGTAPWLISLGWRRAAWVPAIVLFMLGIAFYLLVRNSPSDAGLPDTLAPVPPEEEQRQTVTHPTFRFLAAAYFFVKMVRYTFLFWLPLYLTQDLAFTAGRAGYVSGFFELAGVLGVLMAGYLSDRVFQSRRFPVGALLLAGLSVVCLLQPLFVPHGLPGAMASIALLGILTYGPDTLLSGAAAQDASKLGKMGAGVGTLDGIGSLGQFLSPYLVAGMVHSFGWHGLFIVLSGTAFLAAAILAFGARIESKSLSR